MKPSTTKMYERQLLNQLQDCLNSALDRDELRIPLTAILLSADLLERWGHQWPEQKKNKHLQRIQNSAIQLAESLSYRDDRDANLLKNCLQQILEATEVYLMNCIADCLILAAIQAN